MSELGQKNERYHSSDDVTYGTKKIMQCVVLRVLLASQTKVGHPFWKAISKEGYIIYNTQFHWLAVALYLIRTVHAVVRQCLIVDRCLYYIAEFLCIAFHTEDCCSDCFAAQTSNLGWHG